MSDLNDLEYRQRVAHLLQMAVRTGDRRPGRALEREVAILTDIRWWPTVLSLLAFSPTPWPTLPGLGGLWVPPIPQLPTRAIITVADSTPWAELVREVLQRLPPRRLGPVGAINLLLTLPDPNMFPQEASKLAGLMDDTFFEALSQLQAEAESLGLEAFSQQVESLRQLLIYIRVRETVMELAAQVVRARSDRARATLVVQQARMTPTWLRRGLEEAIHRARRGEGAFPGFFVAVALQKAIRALEKGVDPALMIAHLEEWRPLRWFVQRQRLLERSPFPIRAGEDWLARYGARARAFLLQLAHAERTRTSALLRLALAESKAEEEQAITEEPRLLSVDGARQARLLADETARQGQFTLAARLSGAADRIVSLLDELGRPEHNPVARLAEQIWENRLTLEEALARVQEPEFQREIRIPHLAAMDERATHMLMTGDLHRAEPLAALNHAAARQTTHPKIQIDTAISLAEIRDKLGKLPEAVSLLEESAHLAEKIGDLDRLTLVTGLLGTTYQNLGDHERARHCYERALELARTTGQETLEVAGLGNLALLSLQTGDITTALSLSEQALAMAREAGDPHQFAQSLGTRAAVLHRSGHLEEAVALYREALNALEGLTDIVSQARYRLYLGQALAEMGRFREAQTELEQALALAGRMNYPPLRARALDAIGALYLRLGDRARSLRALEQALAIEGGLSPLDSAFCWLRVAAIHIDMEQLTFAERALHQVEVIAASVHSPHLEAALAFHHARYRAARGQWSECENEARRALTLAHRLQDANLETAVLGVLGQACEALERPQDAEAWYVAALERARERGYRAEEADALLHLGILRARQGRPAEARDTLKIALEVAQSLGLTHLQYYAHYHLGLLCTGFFGDLSAALTHFRIAIALLEQERAAMRQVEALERRYVAGRQDIYRLAAEVALRLDQPLDALEILEQGRARLLARRALQKETLPSVVPEELRERFSRTLQAVQFLRSAVYNEPDWAARLIEEARHGLKLLKVAKTEEEFEQLMAQARAQQQQQARQALAEAEAELDEVVRQIKTCVPDFDPWSGGALPDWADGTADPATAVVVLFVGQEVGRALVLHPSGLHTVDLPGLRRSEVESLLYGLPEPLAQALAEFRRQSLQAPDRMGTAALVMHILTLRWMLEQPTAFRMGWLAALHTLVSEKRQAEWRRALNEGHSVPEAERAPLGDIDDAKRLQMWQHLLDNVAAGLKERLWQPLLPLLRELGVERVVLIPDAHLHTLPLALGLADEPDAPAVAIAPSLTLYAQCVRWLREREPRENTLMLIVNPTGDLTAADVEAALLRELFAAHGQVTFALAGDQATEQRVARTSRVGNYWHFAGHASYEGWNPSLSALRLAAGRKLPFFLIPMWLDFRATRLVALSACETAMTPARDSTHEFEGLFAAFLTAGAPAVLVSLWPVPEISTALLMYRFYQYHLGDPRAGIAPRPPADALRDAQRWLRTLPAETALEHPLVAAVRPRTPHRKSPVWQELLALESGVEYPWANPYFWAGFVLVGL